MITWLLWNSWGLVVLAEVLHNSECGTRLRWDEVLTVAGGAVLVLSGLVHNQTVASQAEDRKDVKRCHHDETDGVISLIQ